MAQAFNIQYLSHHEVDKTKWDRCIREADNGLIYGYSFYLDHMADHWDGLVLNDYEAIMPLTWNKKYGIHYLYQPFLCAQLGVFGKNIETKTSKSFLKEIPPKFKYWDISLNHHNILHLKDFNIVLRNNFVLKLSSSYDTLYKNYKENIQRNIKKAFQLGCVPQTNFPVEQVIELSRQQMKSYSNQKHEFERFRKLYYWLHQRNQAITYGIFSGAMELLSSCVFFFSNNRAYYVLVGNHPNGRTMGASHALIDAFIKDHAGKNLALDFEGSDIRNLAFFYSSFGATDEKYPAVRLNNLPWYFKWAKK
ncbi:MAG TPA: hypothetical protein VGQ53_06465 [Chitinophagaceae bacterium]|jgi:hypothetical protein|nr:hypothetical protein [Chitinophagaceae bacterium]